MQILAPVLPRSGVSHPSGCRDGCVFAGEDSGVRPGHGSA